MRVNEQNPNPEMADAKQNMNTNIICKAYSCIFRFWMMIYCLLRKAISTVKLLDYFFIPFEDIVVEDVECFMKFIQKQILILAYKGALIIQLISFAFIFDRKRIGSRVIFSFISLYAIYDLKWLISSSAHKHLKLWVIIDLFSLFFLNTLNFESHSSINILLKSSIFFGLCNCFKNELCQFLCALGLSLYASLLSVHYGSDPFWENFVITLFFYTITIYFIKIIMMIINEYNKRLLQAREKTQLDLHNKNMFLASIAHDLKNPINSILGFIDQLKNSSNLNKEDKAHLNTASFACQIMHNLIKNIVDISKVENGKFSIDRLPMCIKEEVKKITKIEAQLIRMKGLNFYKKYLTPIPNMVLGDSMRFTQLLMNLIGNAMKFTTHGYVAVTFCWVKHVNDVIKNDTFNELCEGLIPLEEEFMPNSLRRSTFCKKKLGSSDLLNVRGLQENSPIEGPEDYNEGFTETVQDKIKKYSQSPQRVYTEGKGEPTSVSSITLQKKDSHFRREMLKRKGTGDKFSFGEQESDTSKHVKLEENETESEKEIFDEEDFGDSGMLIIDIIDTGIGMTNEEQKKLFQPFSQANSSIKHNFGGTGLGLWITKQIVQIMCGVVEVKSQPHKGTRFRMTIPFELSKEDQLPIQEIMLGAKNKKQSSPQNEIIELRLTETAKFNGRRGSLRSERILLLEDENKKSNTKLTQIYNQLKCTDIQLVYSTYEKALDILCKDTYAFFAILVIASSHSLKTKRVITKIMKHLQDNEQKQIPCAVASGIF